MSLPIIYIKSGCPWCTEALTYFKQKGVRLDVRDVLKDRGYMQEMKSISGQTLTPTFQFSDFMVADFSVDEFKTALAERPDIATKLNLK